MNLRTSGPPPKDWTNATTSELVAEVARCEREGMLQFSKAATELDRRLPVPK